MATPRRNTTKDSWQTGSPPSPGVSPSSATTQPHDHINHQSTIAEPTQHRNRKLISWVFFPYLPSPSYLSFPLPSFPFPFSFPGIEVAPQIQLRDLGSDVTAWRDDICNQQTRFLDFKYTKNAFAAELTSGRKFLVYLEFRKRVFQVVFLNETKNRFKTFVQTIPKNVHNLPRSSPELRVCRCQGLRGRRRRP